MAKASRSRVDSAWKTQGLQTTQGFLTMPFAPPQQLLVLGHACLVETRLIVPHFSACHVAVDGDRRRRLSEALVVGFPPSAS
jgi:hypothetical protein